MNSFAGKCVVVTGGSRGIGEAIARWFANEGASVVITGTSARTHELAAELTQQGQRVVGVQGDVTDLGHIQEVYATARELGGVDVSVQCAGIMQIVKFEALSLADWQRMMDVNTTAAFLCCQAAIAEMRQHKRGGRIINISSVQYRQATPFTANYAASKFAIAGLTQSLAQEVAKEGITVNALCPGVIDTDMWQYNDKAFGDMLGGNFKPGEVLSKVVDERIPMGRVGTGADVAGVAGFLASPAASYVTGQAINVDGGMYMS